MQHDDVNHMTNRPPVYTSNPEDTAERTPGVWRVGLVLAQNIRALVVIPLVTAALAVLISFLFPNTYRSTVTILPPERTFQSMDMPWDEISLMAGGGMALPVMATPSDILAAVVTSRTVRDSLVSKMSLAERWQTTPDAASITLKVNSGAEVELSGIVRAWVHSTDRHFADTLANGMVLQADRVNRQIVNTKARRTREFVEKRLVETEADMEAAAERLEQFQNEHRTVALETQIQQMIENAAAMQAQLTADEIELSVLEQTHSAEHPQVQHLRSRIRETQRRLDAIQSNPGDTSIGFAAGLSKMPHLVQQLADITRELKVAENLYTLLSAEYENARIQEQRDTPSFSVLDRAVGGGEKVSPMRSIIGVATFVSMFALVLAVVVAREYFAQLGRRDPEQYRALRAVWTELRHGWRKRN
ncbi:MAG: hypothetical protein GF341_03640 [candidate division Zixibacteria bacterium]|nr:hypothetical protein [candidate division Zixibacteria bacterium]